MSIYARRILPWLIDFGMRRKRFCACARIWWPAPAARCSRSAIGSGLNLPFYHRDLEGLWGIDPSPELLAMARTQAAWVHFPVSLAEARAEELPLDDGSVDSVVMTWTLCSVAEPEQALAEIRRVLRPGGCLLFIEHGLAPDAGVHGWQDRLTPLWRKVAGGCHLNRPIDRLIEAAGLRLTDLETGYLVKGPRPLTFHFRGRARA